MFLIHLGVPLKIALEGTYFDELVYQQPDKTCVLDHRVSLRIKLGSGEYPCYNFRFTNAFGDIVIFDFPIIFIDVIGL